MSEVLPYRGDVSYKNLMETHSTSLTTVLTQQTANKARGHVPNKIAASHCRSQLCVFCTLEQTRMSKSDVKPPFLPMSAVNLTLVRSLEL